MPHGTGAAPGLAVATAPPAWCDTAGRSGRQPGPVAAPAGVIASRNAASAAEPVPIAPRSTAGGIFTPPRSCIKSERSRPANVAELDERAPARAAYEGVALVPAVGAPAAPAAGQLRARLPRAARVHVMDPVAAGE